MGNKVINFCDSVTYLGVKISANLSEDEDIFLQVRSSYSAANKLKAKFSKCSYVVKNMLFCRYCVPFYACHLWNNFRKSSYNRIKVAYTMMLIEFFIIYLDLLVLVNYRFHLVLLLLKLCYENTVHVFICQSITAIGELPHSEFDKF